MYLTTAVQREGADMLVQDIRFVQQLLDHLESVEDLDQPGVVIVEGAAVVKQLKRSQRLVRSWCAAPCCHV